MFFFLCWKIQNKHFDIKYFLHTLDVEKELKANISCLENITIFFVSALHFKSLVRYFSSKPFFWFKVDFTFICRMTICACPMWNGSKHILAVSKGGGGIKPFLTPKLSIMYHSSTLSSLIFFGLIPLVYNTVV